MIRIMPILMLEEAMPILWEQDLKSQKINFPQDFPQKDLFEERIRKEYAEQPEGFFFIEEEGKAVGSLILMIKVNPYRGKRYGDVRAIYLDEDKRGKGYGTEMLQFADEFFKKHGCSYIFAGISAYNPASVSLFTRGGFHQVRIILEKEYKS